MIIRVCSLYGHRKLVIWSLYGCFVAVLAVTIVTQGLYINSSYTILLYEFLPGCIFWNAGNTNIQWGTCIPALSFEGALIFLTMCKVISYRNGMNQIIRVLARDSIVYFIIVFAGLALTVANVIHPFSVAGFPVLFATQCIISLVVGRMMMNIRGLILDDPEHTVHLRTLKFANRHGSGSETEEAF